MPKKLKEKKFLHSHNIPILEDEKDQGFETSKMNGKVFEVDKDVLRSKKIKPEQVFQGYNKKRKSKKQKGNKNKSSFEKPQPISEKKTNNTYRL